MYAKYYVTDFNFLKLTMWEITLGYFKSGELKQVIEMYNIIQPFYTYIQPDLMFFLYAYIDKTFSGSSFFALSLCFSLSLSLSPSSSILLLKPVLINV